MNPICLNILKFVRINNRFNQMVFKPLKINLISNKCDFGYR